ncbi:hypothetical protein B5M42_016595 [Paenibacillus athensensis]|uniref:Uncharacterized protein n=1 Tax=Paenibacillus athensensis TaxID=1967502 RepID=A0A4Y8PZW1_9BACL|nr:hypothetical protein [Paenibacillus athensensis]MCD1260420.1 hypothetical protein [Paenibacillus athensensis]
MKAVMAIGVKSLLMLIPTILALCLLIRYFPGTGLGRIVAIPEIIFFNSLIAGFGTVLIGKYAARRRGLAMAAYFLVLLLTLAFTLAWYPQEIGPPVTVQLWRLLFE